MKLVFFGTPEFAAAHLEALVLDGHEILAVVTAPDKASGRGLKTSVSEVKTMAEKLHLRVLQPPSLKEPSFVEGLQNLNAEAFIVVAFRMLPEVVWRIPVWGTYNIHASLLPKLRGAAPIQWALINGATHTGVTMFKISHEIDTGVVLLQNALAISAHWNAGHLHEQLKALGCELLIKGIRLMQTFQDPKQLPYFEQNASEATQAPKLFKNDFILKWSDTCQNLLNKIRGLSPYPGAITFFINSQHQRRQLKIINAQAAINQPDFKRPPGHMMPFQHSLLVATGNGWIEVLDLQPEGKRCMSAQDFCNGYATELPYQLHEVLE